MQAPSNVSADYDPRKVIPKYVSDALDNDLNQIALRCHTSDRLLVLLSTQAIREQRLMNEKLQELLDRLAEGE